MWVLLEYQIIFRGVLEIKIDLLNARFTELLLLKWTCGLRIVIELKSFWVIVRYNEIIVN
jgi:hypothetical protein